MALEIKRRELWESWKVLEIELTRMKEIIQNPSSLPATDLSDWIERQKEFSDKFGNLVINTVIFVTKNFLPKGEENGKT